MQMRFLGKTGLQVSELCLGTATFGGLGIFKKEGEINQKEADQVVSMALDAGINFFNTAQIYSDGLAEEIFGKALGVKRKEAVIITKINPVSKPGLNNGGLSRKNIIEGCNASLKRLGTDYIDIYQMHEFDPETPLETSLRALDDLVHAGKVRYIGCSNFTGWQLMKTLTLSDSYRWDRIMTLEAKYSLLCRWPEFELVPVCLDQGVSILAYSPLYGGYLSGKYRRGQEWPGGTRFKQMANTGLWPVDPEQLFNIVEELNRIAESHNATVSQAALNYLLRKPGVSSLIFGVRTADQLEENLKATDWQMSPEEVTRLDKLSEPVRRYPYFRMGID